jgi:alkaline phosphatase D
MTFLTRRFLLKCFAVGSALIARGFPRPALTQDSEAVPVNAFRSDWPLVNDRVWLGKDYWANPMEDWRVVAGAAECQSGGDDRNVHLLTHQFTNPSGSLKMSVQLEQVEALNEDGGAGFRIGIKSDLNEYRSNSFANGGINAGVRNGTLLLGGKSKSLIDGDAGRLLSLTGSSAGDKYSLTLTSINRTGQTLTSVTAEFPQKAVLGNVAIANNFDPKQKRNRGARPGTRYRFSNWSVGGDAFTVTESHTFGPILWSMYTLSDSRGSEGYVLTLCALTPPLGEADNKTIELQVERDGVWKSLGHAGLDPDAWVAKFRIINWDESQAHSYRLVYQDKRGRRDVLEGKWSGTVKANPADRPLRLGALTCQKDYGFPYEPVANNLLKIDPDMLYFSGDQLYEDHGGYGLIRDPADRAILNYLRKFYMFGWSFRDAMKDRPTVCIPDDHDVFQGNIWGENGAAMKNKAGGASSKGGYREPAKMVNVVHRTCAGHHPDYFDPTPCEQDISVYYGDLVYGNVSFAILGDRQFKSGPERVETGSGRADHVRDRDVETSHLDKPGLELLGKRQEDFLKHWGEDWRGHELKVLLSQTVFAGVATHHGNYNGYLKADLDSGGWPQTARNNAIRIMQKAMPLHINGDQHMTSLVQYGVDQQRDHCWSFCTPAIAAGYPRWWRPDELGIPHNNRPQHGLPDTGEFRDGFGNKVYVYAVGNPEAASQKHRYERAHQKGSGFGLVTIDTQAKTYKLEAFRFLVDPTDGNPENQFPGWPLTIHQRENAGDNIVT